LWNNHWEANLKKETAIGFGERSMSLTAGFWELSRWRIRLRFTMHFRIEGSNHEAQLLLWYRLTLYRPFWAAERRKQRDLGRHRPGITMSLVIWWASTSTMPAKKLTSRSWLLIDFQRSSRTTQLKAAHSDRWKAAELRRSITIHRVSHFRVDRATSSRLSFPSAQF